MMNIFINSQPTEFTGQSITDLIVHLQQTKQLHLTQQRFAIELNHNIVFKKNYDATILKDGDQLEIVIAVGGG